MIKGEMKMPIKTRFRGGRSRMSGITPGDDVSHSLILPILSIDVKNVFRVLRIGI